MWNEILSKAFSLGISLFTGSPLGIGLNILMMLAVIGFGWYVTYRIKEMKRKQAQKYSEQDQQHQQAQLPLDNDELNKPIQGTTETPSNQEKIDDWINQ